VLDWSTRVSWWLTVNILKMVLARKLQAVQQVF
jgi:hypothetical protein